METFGVSVDSPSALIFQLLFSVSAADCSVLVTLSGPVLMMDEWISSPSVGDQVVTETHGSNPQSHISFQVKHKMQPI